MADLALDKDNLKEGIIAHDLNRRIFFFNREAEKITGYARQEMFGKRLPRGLRFSILRRALLVLRPVPWLFGQGRVQDQYRHQKR
jgi:PAS domain-containing protein